MIFWYSDIEYIKEVARKFQIVDGEITHVDQINSGRINDSFKITVTQENDTVSYMLQRINSGVFKDVEAVMNNALLITSHLRMKGMETLEYVFTKSGEPLYYDDNGAYRMTKFIHAEIFQHISRPKDMYNLGYAVGQFSVGLSDFDATKLVDTIPNFHNTVVRYENLLKSAVDSIIHKNTMKDTTGRVEEATAEIDFINSQRELYGTIVNAITRGDIPLRVTHNDTKLNNVLFDRKTNVPRCLIDLDTVMSGSILYDIADAIRSGANTRSEEERRAGTIKIDLELLKEFLVGFSMGAPGMLTKNEIELLPAAINIIPLELGMRFLADYFDGDQYFGIVNSDDNLVRARVQFALARNIHEHMNVIKDIVASVFN